MTRRAPVILLILAATLVVAVTRVLILANVEPRYDQAFFAWWVRSLAVTDHLWPRGLPGDGLFEALKSDTTSLAHQLFRNLYNKPTSMLTLLPLGVIGSVSAIFSDSYVTQTTISILWASLVLPLLGGFGWWGRGTGFPRHGTALLAMGLAALNPTLFWFSPLGIHNFGLVGLLSAVAATEARLSAIARGEPPNRAGKAEASLHLVAYYSHWTNAFLLPVVTLLAHWLAGKTIRRRILGALSYVPVLVILGLSLAPLLALEFYRPAEGQVHSLAAVTHMTTTGDRTQLLYNGLASGKRWLEMAGQVFTWPGSVGAAIGLGLLWKRGLRVPALLVLTHLTLFVVMPGFAGAGLRVYPYIIPLFCLGLAEALVVLAGSIRRRQWASVLVLTAHLASQAPSLLLSNRAAAALPEFWRFYYRGQGELRPMIRAMDTAVPEGAVLLSWSYGLYCVHEALRQGPPVAAVLDGLWLRHTLGSLDEYLSRRPKITAPRIFLVTEDDEVAGLSLPLTKMLAVVLGSQGLNLRTQPRLVPINHWTLSTLGPGNTTLWEVVEGE